MKMVRFNRAMLPIREREKRVLPDAQADALIKDGTANLVPSAFYTPEPAHDPAPAPGYPTRHKTPRKRR